MLLGKLRELHESHIKFNDSALLDVNEDLTDYLNNQLVSLYLVDEFIAVSFTRDVFKLNVSRIVFSSEDA